jgi:hypothetical protein
VAETRSAAISGWILELIAWLVEAAAVGQIIIALAPAVQIGLGGFDYRRATTTPAEAPGKDPDVNPPANVGIVEEREPAEGVARRRYHGS